MVHMSKMHEHFRHMYKFLSAALKAPFPDWDKS